MFSDVMYQWLDACLDYGITEEQFWDMTIAELTRAVESKKRLEKLRLQERATFDYTMADLIARSVSRLMDTNIEYPQISEVYPTLFDSGVINERQQEKKDELSALRFKQFADSFNTRMKKGGGKDK